MSVELSECVPQLPARLLLRQEHHPLEVDRQAEAEHGLDKDADCLEKVNPSLKLNGKKSSPLFPGDTVTFT